MNQNLMRAGVRLMADSTMIFCSRSYLQLGEEAGGGTARAKVGA
jgi:hypothetical protein